MGRTGRSRSPVACSICLASQSWPKARPKICEHIFCYLCIDEWMKRRSECPLCRQATDALVVINEDSSQHEVSVAVRTAAQYEIEVQNDDDDEAQEVEDITVAYARCQVCSRSDNEHLLLLCDGIVGQNIDGSPLRCNAACHCYCLPERLESVPDEEYWFCSFCRDFRATQESVYSTRYVEGNDAASMSPPPSTSIAVDDQPGNKLSSYLRPSGINGSRIRGASQADVLPESESESEIVSSAESSETSENEAEEDSSEDWAARDDMILAEDSGTNYNPVGLTEVTRRNKRSRRKKAKKRSRKFSKRKVKHVKTTKKRAKSTNIRSKKGCSGQRNRKRKKSITIAQRRLAEAIGLDPLTGRQKRKRSTGGRSSSYRSRRGVLGVPVLSIRGGDDFDIPTEEQSPCTESDKEKTSVEKTMEGADLLDAIMREQTKTLAPARYQRVLRDGTIVEIEEMAEDKRKFEDKFASCKTQTSSKNVEDSNVSTPMHHPTGRNITGVVEKRKKRPSRWGTPTTSVNCENASLTATIPLPVGPPSAQSTIPLENIPIPSTSSLSQIPLSSGPSALNTAPSTSFALHTSFGLNGQPQIGLAQFAGSSLQQPLTLNQQSLANIGQQINTLGQQTLAGLSQQSVAASLNQSMGQGSLVQMQPHLLPNIFIPPINLNAMNSLLAAGLLANNNALAAPSITQTLAQTSPSAPTAPFILNPMQLSTSAQQLNQHIVNLASTLQQRSTDSNAMVATQTLPHQISKLPEGVPPPPPISKPPEPTSNNNVSLCEPLAEKIRKLIEASNVRPLCDSTTVDDGNTRSVSAAKNKAPAGDLICAESKACESGRKSASADDEEADAAKVKKYHKNGAMFEEARRMLSSSLKKAYRSKQISKEEYKEIMKKGVNALSQRTKLDQEKVDEYATKYVECIIHRRKKRH